MRLSALSTLAKNVLCKSPHSSTVTKRQSSEWHYRTIQPPTQKSINRAEFIGTVMWTWIFWHFFTDYGHIIGHFPLPDPKSFTNQELGIMSDE